MWIFSCFLISWWVNRELYQYLSPITFQTTITFHHKPWQKTLADFPIELFNPGCRPDWAAAAAAQCQRARHQTGWRRPWPWRGGGWGRRPGERAGCWRCSALPSCAERGRAPARVFWATARSSRARASPELAWSLSWTAGRWWGSSCCCSSPARWWRQRGRGGRTRTPPGIKTAKRVADKELVYLT